MIKKIMLAILAIAAYCVAARAQDTIPNHPVRFAWGASLATSIDMTEGDMSNIGIEAYAGIKAPGVQILGVGSGMCVPVTNALRSIPLFIIARTNFHTRPTLLFMDARAGVAINYLDRTDGHQAGAYGSLGLGIRLASNDKFQSHLIIAYTYMGRKDYYVGEERVPLPDLHMATLRLGISF